MALNFLNNGAFTGKLNVETTGISNTAIFENSGQSFSYTAIKVGEALGNRANLTFVVGDNLAATDLIGEIGCLITSDGGALEGAMSFKTNSGDTLTERMVISSAGALRFNAYGAGTLITDASGNITVSSGGGAGGPYLPLAGGTMTGNVVFNTGGDSSIKHTGSGSLVIRNEVDNQNVFLQADNGSGGNATYIQLDGSTGEVLLSHYGANKLATKSTGITVTGEGIFTGNVGIGTTSPQQKLHIVSTDGANIILNSNTGAENNGIWMTEGGVATPYVNGAYVHYDGSSNEFKINTGTTSLATRFTIARDTGAIKFNAYGAGTLVTDASGNITVSSGGGSGGPYLPLAGGTLSGSVLMTLSGTYSPELKFQNDTYIMGIDYSNTYKLRFINRNTNSVKANLDLSNGNFDTVGTLAVSGTGDSYFTGNVGIGTTSPDNILHIRKGDTGYGSQVGVDTMLMLETTNVSNSLQFSSTTVGNQYIMFGDDDPNAGWIAYAHSDNSMNFRTAGAERMRIDAGGNLGIGTDDPDLKLDVESTNSTVFSGTGYRTAIFQSTSAVNADKPGIQLGYDTAGGGIIAPATQAGTTNFLGFWTYNSGWGERVRIAKDGNVGIGSTNPTTGKLVVSSSANQLALETGTAGDGRLNIGHFYNGAFIGTYGDDGGVADLIRFGTHSGDERMRITSAGNVGIGITNPQAKLDVVSANLGTAINNTSTQAIFGVSNSNFSNLYVQDYRTAAGTDWTSSGKRIQMRIDSTYMGYMQFNGTGNNGGISFGTGTSSAQASITEKIKILASGATTFTSTVTATNFILSSDERLKENIKEVCDNRIKADWKTFELKTERGQKRYGVIAQELEKTNPEFVREDSQGFKAVAYIDLLIAKIAELEARLEKLEK